MTDEDYMREALGEAQAASARGEVPVGAILVNPQQEYGDKTCAVPARTRGAAIVARGANAPILLSDPTAHAEIMAIRDAAYKTDNYRLTGLTLYVTLEPCTMCAGAISNARIARVVYGATDPKGGAVESGVNFFDQPSCHHSPEVTGGVMAEECGTILKEFFKARRKVKPSKGVNTDKIKGMSL